MSKIMVRGLLILLIASFLGCDTGGVQGDYEAPGFELKDLDGKTVSLEEHRGRIVVVDFWATWCPPCLMSIPEMVEVQEKYRDKGVTILGISVDLPGDVSEEDLRTFKNKMKMNYTILRADDRVMEDYFGGKGTQMAIPTLFVVDKEGKVREKLVGFRPGKIEETLQRLLS
jgi:cytochrome c biogenesis protein CcmG, thiol:disulfide interchange protein DsbE